MLILHFNYKLANEKLNLSKCMWSKEIDEYFVDTHLTKRKKEKMRERESKREYSKIF